MGLRTFSLIVSVLCALPGRAQNEARPSFDVAAIKPSSQPFLQILPRRSGGRITWTTGLAHLIAYAYDLPLWRISGPVPGDDHLYAIDASVDPSAAEPQVHLMFQSLLAERFKMTSHRVPREANGYALKIGKGGLKIHEADANLQAPVPESLKGAAASGLEGKVVVTLPSASVEAITGRRVSMSQLCIGLERALQMFVSDETGLKGNYYFELHFAREGAAGDTDAPSLFTALQDLGLRLEKKKGPMEVLVVDHIESTPTEN